MDRRHAYLILAHKNFGQLRKLAGLLDDPRNDIYVHVDRKSASSPEEWLRGACKYSRLSLISPRISVSWGGVITSIISGYDDRFAFSVPIYCSLNLAESRGGTLSSYYRAHPEARVWDDDEGLSRVETPLFFLAMNDDVNALPDSISYTASRCKNAQVALVRGWAHSHSHAFARPEPYAFADSIVNGGEETVRVLTQPHGSSGRVEISVPEGRKVKAYIAFTGGNMDKIPEWGHIRLTLQEGSVSYEITEQMRLEAGGEVTFYYIWFVD